MKIRRTWPLFVIGLLILGLWGASQYANSRRWENRVDSQYQRAFNDLTQNLGTLETNLAKASVASSPRYLRQTMAEIWRSAYAAQEKLGQLPLGTVELSRMKMLLAKVAVFAYQTTDRPADSLQLSENDWKTLQGLRDHARYVSGQLTSMQANIVQNNLRWVDVERLGGARITAAALAKRLGNNPMTKTLSMVEDGLKRLPDPGFPETAVIYQAEPKSLSGRKISAEEGKRIALDFVDRRNEKLEARYLGTSKSTPPTYLYSLTPADGNGAAVRVSVSERGGRVAWMIDERSLGDRRLNLAKATAVAEKFAADKGLRDMTVVSREEYDRTDVITLAPKINGSIHYPEIIKVEVAMDNGQVVGFEGLNYLVYYDSDQKFAAPRLSRTDVEGRLNRHLKPERIRQAVIIDARTNEEVLTYEVLATLNDERFLIYLDAGDGTEVKIRRIDANGVEID